MYKYLARYRVRQRGSSLSHSACTSLRFGTPQSSHACWPPRNDDLGGEGRVPSHFFWLNLFFCYLERHAKIQVLETKNCIVVKPCMLLVHLPVGLGLEGNVGLALVAQGLLLVLGWLLMDLSCFILKVKNFRPGSYDFKLIWWRWLYGLCINWLINI